MSINDIVNKAKVVVISDRKHLSDIIVNDVNFEDFGYITHKDK